jgi:hypothetical protein
MNKMISDLKDAKIIDMQQIHDYLQIATTKGKINIYNTIKYFTADKVCLELCQPHFKDIIDCIIIDIEYEEFRYLSFKISNENSIAISLDDNDYNGPEAFYIILNSGEMIVG